MLYHKCAIAECKSQILTQHLMCPPHWEKVPYYLRQIIWSNHRRRRFGTEYYKAVETAKQIVSSMPKAAQRVTWRQIMTRPRSA